MLKKEIPEKIGRTFAEIVAKVSFMLWEKTEFRAFIEFDKISQTDQDRIFNEIEVSFLGLFSLYLENLSKQVGKEDEKDLIDAINIQLIKGFLAIYRDLNVDEKFVTIWEQLIELRFKEYKKDYQMLIKKTEKDKDLKKIEIPKATWARIQTITLDCLTNIRKGKLDEKDPLRKYLQDWVVNVDKLSSDAMKNLVFDPKGIS